MNLSIRNYKLHEENNLSSSKSICNHEMDTMKIKKLLKILVTSEGEHLERAQTS